MTNGLTVVERKSLTQHEATIERGLRDFVEVGNALAAIREDKLYRATHKTFEAYCRERWDLSKTHCNRLIGASQVMERLAPIGVIPTTESQIRPLTTIELDQVGDVWQECVERAEKGEDGKPRITAKHVKETVDFWREADEPYVEPVEPEFDELAEVQKVLAWGRKIIERWPKDCLISLHGTFHNLATETKP